MDAIQLSNPLKRKVAAGEPVIGMWSIIPSATLAEILALAGLDFLILDMEHGPYDLSVLAASVQALEGADCSPLVRVPGVDPFKMQAVLDLGVHGLIVPQVQDAAEARRVVESMTFPPLGVRGYNPFTRAAAYSRPSDNRVGKLNDAFALKAIIVESKGALECLDSILAIEEIDVVYVGVYDLAVALGHHGNTRHPEVEAVLRHAIRRTRDAGKAAGMMVLAPEEIGGAVTLGANFVVCSVDGYFIHQAASGIVDAARLFKRKD